LLFSSDWLEDEPLLKLLLSEVPPEDVPDAPRLLVPDWLDWLPELDVPELFKLLLLDEFPELVSLEPLRLLLDDDGDEDELDLSLLSVELWACALMTKHAAQNAIAAITLFFMVLPFFFGF